MFIPTNLWNIKSGWLLGWWVNTPRPYIFVLAVLHSPEPANQKLSDRSVNPEGRVGFTPSVLGEVWNDDREEIYSNFRASTFLRDVSEFYLKLRIVNGQLLVQEVTLNKLPVDIEENCTVYVYDPLPFLSSKLLTIRNQKDCSRSVFVREEFKDYTCIEKLLAVLRQWQELQLSDICEISDVTAQSSLNDRSHYHAEAETITERSRFTDIISVVKKIIYSSAFVQQVKQRVCQVAFIGNPFASQGTCLRCQNTLSAIAIDILFGLLILYHMHQWLATGHVFDLFLFSAETIMNQLQTLIRWLMGVPAGLKLNQPLTTALGSFFLYHIHLWRTFITVIKPVLAYMMETISILGYFGVTFQLSMLSDLISLATFHIYCFYVYAARLYNLHLSGLVSLWRLVRGRKWNPLRRRVDSCHYTVDQLFLGTLLFMILLFLLPTTMLYYVVFSTLRLGVLTVLGIINRLTTMVNTAPVYVMLLNLSGAQLISGNVHFTICPCRPIGQPAMLTMKVNPVSLQKVCQATMPINFCEKQTATYKQLITDLVFGNLIYPF